MKHIELFNIFESGKKSKKVHTLSGVLLIIEDRILLVHAKKYFAQNNRWSLPKGHIEGNSLDSALKELKEETGILLDENYDNMIEFDYRKGGITKLMDVYIYKRERKDFLKYLDGWTIKPEFYDKNEIIGAKFFNNITIRKRIDIGMIDILSYIE